MEIYGRYLTAPEKMYILSSLQNEVAKGRVDRDIIPFLNDINEVPGVVTTQSCAGHDDKPGYISIRLSERMNELFERYIDVMFQHDGDLHDHFSDMEQNWESFVDSVSGRPMGRPRWVFWYDKENAAEFLTNLSAFLWRLSRIDG